MNAPFPTDEPHRLDELLKLNVLDAAPDAQLQSIAEIAASVFEVPIALVSLVDAERQLFKARVGLEVNQTCRDYAFCAYAILQHEPLVVENAAEDPRFASNPLVTSAPHIRFYAGAPLTTVSGYRLGTLCIIDSKSRWLAEGQVATLKMLASLAVDVIQARRRLDVAEARSLQNRSAGEASRLQLSALGHELRTPLNHILGFVDLLKANLASGDARQQARNLEYLDIVRQSASHLAALVDKVADLEGNGSETELKVERIDLNQVLEPVVKSFAGTVGGRRQRISFAPSSPPALALADATSLRQIALNLVSNASKYAPEGAEITVAVAGDGSRPWCTLVVEDDGPGIPEAVLERLGEPFLRGDGTRDAQQGSGLGLHVTLKLCRAMRGALKIDRRDGGGTRATVRLPAADLRRCSAPRLVAG